MTSDEGVRRAYAADASGLYMIPDSVERPGSEREVVEVLRRAGTDMVPVTPAGGQTSTTGASVTDRGILLSLRAMDAIRDIDVAGRVARVEAGVVLSDLRTVAAGEGLMLTPDPTSEGEATVGGAIACNASGARSLMYGAIRRHVRALRVALASGEVIEVRRPGLEKNTAGYLLAQDPVDWFVGSEGTLGVVLEAELALLHEPRRVTGFIVPFAAETDALDFVVAARESAAVRARCLEYFDGLALEIARGAGAGIPQLPWASGASALVYAEDVADEGGGADDAPLDEWLALASRHRALADDVVVLESESAMRAVRVARHAVPAAMNERGSRVRSAGGRKVSTDWAVPYRSLRRAIAGARAIAAEGGVEQPVIYGHAGSGHPHENFVARDAAELERVEHVVGETLRYVLGLGGTVSAEHGIGKLKRRWLPLQLSRAQLGVMGAVKRELDPLGILAPGNVFDESGRDR